MMIERHGIQHIHAHLLHQRSAFLKRGEHRRAFFGCDQHQRVIQKRACHQQCVVLIRQRAAFFQQYAVTDVHAVKHAERNHTALRRKLSVQNDLHRFSSYQLSPQAKCES